MEFNEKIVFLLNITATNNVELANALNVKPSIISLYKTGKRGIPKKESTLRRFSDFFSEKMVSEYHLKAITEAMDLTHIAPSVSNEELSNLILAWFQDKPLQYADSSLKIIHSFEYGTINEGDVSELVPERSSFERFAGRNAKANAVRKCLQHLLTVEKPGTLYLQIDSKSDWFFNDRSLSFEFIHVLGIMLERGAKVKIFLPPPSCDYFLDLFAKSLPLIFSEKVEMYYYPRFKDNSFRNMMMVLENEISLFNFGLYNGLSTGMVILTDYPLDIRTAIEILNDYAEVCKPAIIYNTDQKSILEVIRRIIQVPAPIMSLHSRLSPFLTPSSAFEEVDKVLTRLGLQDYARTNVVSDNVTAPLPVIELCKVATAKQVRNGEVKIFCPFLSDEQEPAYTPKTYADHLRNILYHMENDANYTFIPIPFNELKGSVIIRKGSHAVLLHKRIDPALFEIVEPDIVRTLEEYLNQKIDRYGGHEDARANSIRQLKRLIKELEN